MNDLQREKPLAMKKIEPLEAMQAIYGRCREDSLVAFGSERKDKKGEVHPLYLALVRQDRLKSLLPEVIQYHADEIHYIAPNTFQNGALKPKFTIEQYESALLEPFGKPLYFHAMKDFVKELCAITIDLDVGREGDISAEEGLKKIERLCREGALPRPSLAGFSGRGVYILFLLREEISQLPPLASSDNLCLWKACVYQLLSLLFDLKADSNATSICNWYKCPGTVDKKTGKQVFYARGEDLPLYTLSDLAKRLKVPAGCSGTRQNALERRRSEETTSKSDRLFRTSRSGRKRNVKPGKGSEYLWLRIKEMEAISRHRGGLRKGCRHMALFHYWNAYVRLLKMRYGGTEKFALVNAEAKEKVLIFNSEFTPPLPPSEVEYAMTKPRGRAARGSKIRFDLRVSMKEVEELNLRQIAPPRKPRVLAIEREILSAKKMKNYDRRRFVDELIHSGASYTEIAEQLKDHFTVSPRYVSERRTRLSAQTAASA